MRRIFNLFVIIALLAVLYGFYNIMFSHENNKEDFLIYNPANKRLFEYLDNDQSDLTQTTVGFDEEYKRRQLELDQLRESQKQRIQEIIEEVSAQQLL